MAALKIWNGSAWVTIAGGEADLSNHISNDGSDHSFIDQDVTTVGTPTFAELDVDNININGNTISSTVGDVILAPDLGDIDCSQNGVASMSNISIGNVDAALSASNILNMQHRFDEDLGNINHAGYLSLTDWESAATGNNVRAFNIVMRNGFAMPDNTVGNLSSAMEGCKILMNLADTQDNDIPNVSAFSTITNLQWNGGTLVGYSGDITDLTGWLHAPGMGLSGGTVTNETGFKISQPIFRGTTCRGIWMDDISGSTNNYGIVMGDVSGGSGVNFAIKTGLGDVFFGDDVEMDGALNHDGSTVGFYGTAPVSKQTTVAVSAAGIHAALVNLGLIAGP